MKYWHPVTAMQRKIVNPTRVDLVHLPVGWHLIAQLDIEKEVSTTWLVSYLGPRFKLPVLYRQSPAAN